MKKIVSALLCAAVSASLSAAAFAAPVQEENGSLQNTVVGFSGGAKETRVDLRQMDGSIKIPFDLGEKTSDYHVEIDILQGGRQLDATYSKTKNALILYPNADIHLTVPEEYELELRIVDRKTHVPVAGTYTLSGKISYDRVQEVESGGHYSNTRGVLYNFDGGADGVEIYAGHDVTLRVENTARGLYNLHLSSDESSALVNKFPDAELSVMRFEAEPLFDGGVTVVFELPPELYVYEYAQGAVQELPGLRYEKGEGFVLHTERLSTYVASTLPLSTGPVQVDGYEPAEPLVKNNPTTGAPTAGE